MNASSLELAGLRTLVVEPDEPVARTVVILHGHAMLPEDLAPFAHSLGVHARFLLPEAPGRAAPAGRAWWPIDDEARARAREAGPRHLFHERPPGALEARRVLLALLREVRERWGDHPLALVGFSQGGMLACDTVLRDDPRVAALALLSSSCITGDEWVSLAPRARGLPVLVSHGRSDPDLAFGAGERLRDVLEQGGAQVSWVPFDGGHEIPLLVWRRLRAFLSGL